MEQPIREILFNELEKRRTSIYQFSKETGIPKGRIYKWKDGDGNPKENDIKTINKWLSQGIGLSTVLDIPIPKKEIHSIPVEEYIQTLKQSNNALTLSISSNLDTIQASQRVLLNTMEAQHQVILKVMENLKSDTIEIKGLLLEVRMKSEGKKDDQVEKPASKGRRRA